MNTHQYIDIQYDKLKEGLHDEYADLYPCCESHKLSLVLSTLHHDFLESFKELNKKLPTGNKDDVHFWAESSRLLIGKISFLEELHNTLRDSFGAFDIDSYHQDLIERCNGFLEASSGSTLPPHMEKIRLYYTRPIFLLKDTIALNSGGTNLFCELKLIGEGSYAHVFRYKDLHYNRYIVLKRAKSDLDDKERLRFKREFEQLNQLRSPYVIEVYNYNDAKNEYAMEYMDETLCSYINKNNTKLTKRERKAIGGQVLKAFTYIHSRDLLHRDVSPNNILVRKYDDSLIVKVADFGLVRYPDSQLTSLDTDLKGAFNDPYLRIEGFRNYELRHETYALSLLLFFVMSGRTNSDRVSDEKMKAFLAKGLHSDKKERFQNINELQEAFRNL